MKKMRLIIAALFITMIGFAQNPQYTEIKIDQLPKNCATYIEKNFSGTKIIRALTMTDTKVKTYVVVVDDHGKKRRYMFDDKGNFKGEVTQDMINKAKQQQNTQPATTTQQAKPATTGASEQAPEKK